MRLEHRKNEISCAGFTVAELLLVVALILIVGAAGVVGGLAAVRNARQNTLDRAAQTMYAAAQNQLTQRFAFGAKTALRSGDGIEIVTAAPADYLGDYPTDEARQLRSIRGRTDGVSGAENAAAELLFPEGTLPDDLRGGNWVVEYDPVSCTVYSVFYSETYADTDTGYREFYGGGAALDTDALRGEASERKSLTNARVGYYAGQTPGLPASEIGDLSCGIHITNGEKLTADFTCLTPPAFDGDVESIRFDIAVRGVESGHEAAFSVTTEDADGVSVPGPGGREYAWRLVLDSLEDGASFAESFCVPNSRYGVTADNVLLPGEDIVVALTVSGQCRTTGHELPAVGDEAATNSLFAYDPDADRSLRAQDAVLPVLADEDGRYIARIACARHLQNLDTGLSGLGPVPAGEGTSEGVAAVQTEDIDLTAGAWDAAYPGRGLAPIANTDIVSYDGDGHVIRGLRQDLTESGDLRGSAGLFATYAGTIGDLTLVDPVIRGVDGSTKSLGGFIGEAHGDVSLVRCALYMEDEVGGATASEVDWISGARYAGGLIGHAAGSVTLEDCFAATVVRASTDGCAGGLVGMADGAVLALRSYADCYLGGGTVGGLAGGVGEGSGFVGCYSAGFVLGAPAVAAGFTPDAAAVSGGISLFDFDDITADAFTGLVLDADGYVEAYPDVGPDATAAVKIAVAGEGSTGSASFTYYAKDVVAPSGFEYTSLKDIYDGMIYKRMDPSWVHPYRLAACLAELPEAYLPPSVVELPHYGDWLERPREDELYARIYHAPWGEVSLVFEYGPAQEGSPFGSAISEGEWLGEDTFLTEKYASAAEVPWAAWRGAIDTVAFRIDDLDGSVRPVSTAWWFADFGYLDRIGDAVADGTVSDRLTKLDTSAVTDMTGMFSGCRRLRTLDVSRFSVPVVSSTSYMFADCESLETLSLSSFAAYQCLSMRGMFSGCTALGTLDLSGMYTPSVQDFGEMFFDCAGLTELDLSGFSTGHATVMYAMFHGCSSLEALDLSGFTTNRVTDMRFMFEGCSALSALDLSGLRTGAVTDMRDMFADCASLERLDLGSFDTSRVTNMSEMFYGCSSLQSVQLGSFDIGAATTLHGMFSGCGSLLSVDMSSFVPTAAGDVSQMFYGCAALEHIYATEAFDVSGADDHNGMFTGCISLRGGSGTRFDSDYTDGTYARLDGGEAAPGYFTAEGAVYARIYEDGGDYTLVIERGDPDPAYGTPVPDCEWNGASEEGFLNVVYTQEELPPWLGAGRPIGRAVIAAGDGHTVTPVSTAWWFYGLDGLTEISGLDAVSTAGVADMDHMFAGCSSLETLDLGGLVTGSAADMSYMFAGCSHLRTLDLSAFNTASVTDMSGMFSDCAALTGLDLSAFRTERVTGMREMFLGCAALTGLDLCAFDTAAVTDMSEMFADCQALRTITVMRTFTADAVTQGEDMFRSCYALTGMAGTVFDGDHMDADRAVIDGEGGRRGYLTAALCAVLHTDGTLTFRLGGGADEGRTAEGTWRIWPGGVYSEDDLPEWVTDGHAERVRSVRFASRVQPSATAYWFYGCSALEEADLTGLDMSGTTDARHMFDGCAALVRIYVDEDFSAASVTESEGMFAGCVSIVGGGETTYDAERTDAAMAVIGTEVTPGYLTDIADRAEEPTEPEEPAEPNAPDGTADGPEEGEEAPAPVEEAEEPAPAGARFERGVIRYDGTTVGSFSADYMPDSYYDGDVFFSDPYDPEGSEIGRLYDLTGSWRPDEGEVYRLTYGDEDVLLSAQFRHTNDENGDTVSEFWRFVCTRDNGVLLFTADEYGRIDYEERKDFDLDTDTMRIYSDDEHTVEVTNLSALLGPKESWPALGEYDEFDVWISGLGWQTLRVDTGIDEDEDLYFTCSWEGEEIFRTWLVNDGELWYPHAWRDVLWYDSYYAPAPAPAAEPEPEPEVPAPAPEPESEVMPAATDVTPDGAEQG